MFNFLREKRFLSICVHCYLKGLQVRTGKFYIDIYFFKLAFVLFLFVLLLQYLNFFGTKITENVPDCKHTYEIFQKCISSHTSVACVAGGFVVFRKVRVTAARKLNRGQKRKRWGRGRGEKTRSAFARLNLETCYKSTSHTAHKFLKVNEASLLA